MRWTVPLLTVALIIGTAIMADTSGAMTCNGTDYEHGAFTGYSVDFRIYGDPDDRLAYSTASAWS